MKCHRNLLLAAVAALLVALSARGQEPIRFARTPDISPDGRLVAFSYLGDIWTVETIGGVARPVTLHEAHDAYPVFSPDGKQIAFSSNRNGSYDLYVVSAQGGRPRRLTFDSAADIANGWSPDGKTILFTSTRSTAFPPSYELYTVPLEGGRVRQITASEGKDGVFSPKGDQIAYVRGPGTWYRKGYRGSANDDVWICDANGGNNHPVTSFNGQDGSPMWSPDGQYVYYVSEVYGTPANIVRQQQPSKPDPKPEQITFHKEESVRRARMSANGEWIVYECGPDLWVVSTKGGSPRKLAIEVHADDKTNPEKTVTYTKGASEYALSYERDVERNVAFVVHGQIFVVPVTGGKATRVTSNAANNHGVAWSPDGRKLLFISDSAGYEDLYLLESDDPENKELVKAHKFKTKQLTKTPEAEIGASFSPDGKHIAFIRSGKLWTMNPDGTGQKILVNDPTVFDYDWSPESSDTKYLVYAREDGYSASDLFIIPVGGGAARNVTRFATYNGGVTWSYKGKKLAFISERRRNQRSLYVLSLQKPAAPGASASNEIDWEDIHLRVDWPAPFFIDEGAISADGNKVAFRALSQNGADLWVASTSGGHLMRLTSGNQRPQQIQWSRRGDTVFYLDSSGSIRKAQAGSSMPSDLFRFSIGGSSPLSDSSQVAFTAKLTIRREEEFKEMFEQSWRVLADEFYDPDYHGAKWNQVREKYRPLVNHVALKEDFYNLVSLMLGELNASHLGIMGPPAHGEETTAELGLVFDDKYQGPGLKIAEVLKRGPADRRGLNLKAGDIVLSVDGTEVDAQFNLSKILGGKVGESVSLQITSDWTNPRAKRRIEIQGADREKIRDLMYDRWVDLNSRRVAELTHGKVGYIHIPSMDEAGMDRFVRALYSDNFDKEAIVLDVRYNGGGYTHDQLLNYLGGREHTIFKQRGGGQGMVLRTFDRKWTKPLVLLINNRSYSDAEIFPSAFRTLGLGKLVGQPTGACVIGTTATKLIDGSLFRIPRIGVYTAANVNMERQGVVPDIPVEQDPNQRAQGVDPQLDKAVEIVQQDVLAWKKTHTSVALNQADDKPPATVPTSRK
jgi:tricorn protease